MLRTERNEPEIAIEILEDASRVLGISEDRLEVFYDHGQHWVEDRETGAQWSVVDAEPGLYAYEQVAQGAGE